MGRVRGKERNFMEEDERDELSEMVGSSCTAGSTSVGPFAFVDSNS